MKSREHLGFLKKLHRNSKPGIGAVSPEAFDEVCDQAAQVPGLLGIINDFPNDGVFENNYPELSARIEKALKKKESP